MVIEKAAGMSVPQFLADKITRPPGLTHTYFPRALALRGTFAHGYDGSRDLSVIDMSWDWTAGAMVSTLHDPRIWARAFGTGQLIGPRLYREQLATRAATSGTRPAVSRSACAL